MTTLLLVEDHVLLRTTLAMGLESLGYRVHVAGSADEALARLSGGLEIDALLTDVQMPGELNGIDLARWMRLNRPHTPILLMSGYLQGDTAGFPILRKPFSPDQLRDALECELGIPPRAADD